MNAIKHFAGDNHSNNNLCSSSMENVDCTVQKCLINIAELPTLKDICCVRIIERIWKHPFVYLLICDIHKASPCLINDNKGFEEIVRTVSNILRSDIRIPVSLRRYIQEFIKPMGWSLYHWLHNLSYFKFNIKELLETFSWKGNGLADKLKSSEALIRGKKPNQYIYEVACYNCISSLVPKVWRKLPIRSQNYYANFYSYTNDNRLNLLVYWTSFSVQAEIETKIKKMLQGCYRIRNICDFPQKSLWKLLEQNPVFMEYYCRIPEFNAKNSIIDLVELAFLFREKDDIHLLQFPLLVSFSFRKSKKPLDICDNANLICRLFSLLNYNQQILILNKHGLFLLEMLIVDWPWRKYFFPVIETMWDFLNENVYIKLILTIQIYIQSGLCPEKDLPEQLWVITPSRFKTCFINHVRNHNIIKYMLLNSTVSFFEEILQSAETTKRQEWYQLLITKKNKFYDFLNECKLDCFDALIKSIATKDEYLLEVKTEVVKMFGKSLCYVWTMKNDLDKVNKFIEWSYPYDEEIKIFKLPEPEKQKALACVTWG